MALGRQHERTPTVTLPPGPWRRGTDIGFRDGSYVTRSRCKTSHKIKHCCSRCGKWEIWRHNMPLSGRYSSWSDARDAFVAMTYGKHDKLVLGLSARSIAVRNPGLGQHRPHPDRWDAAWLLWPQRWVMGTWEPPFYDKGVLITDDGGDRRLWALPDFDYRGLV